MRTRRDALHVLGLRADASTEAVREAYLRLAKQRHPDVALEKCKETATNNFREVLQAYELANRKESVLRTAAQQYEDLMAQRAREPWIIRWIWRGPSVKVKFQLKLLTAVVLFGAALVDDKQRDGRRARQARYK
mmetsp:Transcript_1253/g.3525  ORF Transcript_1253/g.3525 Transcript_1253/m.3525 type:complete len:134 (+) Transcript_1253:177-578(+)